MSLIYDNKIQRTADKKHFIVTPACHPILSFSFNLNIFR